MERHKVLEKLIVRIQNGEKNAFSDLYGATYQKVYFYALKLVKNKESAEDIVQEVYEDAFESLYELNNPRAFTAWINKKTYFHAMNYIRKENRHITVDKDDEIFTNLKDDSSEISPEYAYLNNETEKTIMREIDKLSVPQRSVILLRYHQDLSLKQISEVMGCSLGTVKSRLNVAKNHLKSSVRKGSHFAGISLSHSITKSLDKASKSVNAGVEKMKWAGSHGNNQMAGIEGGLLSGSVLKVVAVVASVCVLTVSGIGAYLVNQESGPTPFLIDAVTAKSNSEFTNKSVYVEVQVTGSNIEKVYLTSQEGKTYEGVLKEYGCYGVYVDENGNYDVVVKSNDETIKKQLSIQGIDQKAPELISAERKDGSLVISCGDDYSGIDWEKTKYKTEAGKEMNIKEYVIDENKIILEYINGVAYLTLYDQAGNHIVYEMDKTEILE